MDSQHMQMSEGKRFVKIRSTRLVLKSLGGMKTMMLGGGETLVERELRAEGVGRG